MLSIRRQSCYYDGSGQYTLTVETVELLQRIVYWLYQSHIAVLSCHRTPISDGLLPRTRLDAGEVRLARTGTRMANHVCLFTLYLCLFICHCLFILFYYVHSHSVYANSHYFYTVSMFVYSTLCVLTSYLGLFTTYLCLLPECMSIIVTTLLCWSLAIYSNIIII